MSDHGDWRELHRSDDPKMATLIVTTIAAMGFEVRAEPVRPADDEAGAPGAPEAAGEAARSGPYIISVRADDHPSLLDVLPEIIDEQEGFDAELAARERRARRAQRLLVVFLAIAIALLTVLGLLHV